jgi:hypothetical protein
MDQNERAAKALCALKKYENLLLALCVLVVVVKTAINVNLIKKLQRRQLEAAGTKLYTYGFNNNTNFCRFVNLISLPFLTKMTNCQQIIAPSSKEHTTSYHKIINL